MLVVRCKNSEAHKVNGSPIDGNILAFLHNESIYIRCPDHDSCKKWNKITIRIPGIRVNYNLAAISQSVIRDEKIKFPSTKAIAVVDNNE